jgi:hypothetical protein
VPEERKKIAFEGGWFEVSEVNHEQTGLEGATEDTAGLPARGPWVRWARSHHSGFGVVV